MNCLRKYKVPSSEGTFVAYYLAVGGKVGFFVGIVFGKNDAFSKLNECFFVNIGSDEELNVFL
jgi:hypothetical protein